MMIRNSFASFSTSRLKMLPDNYSGSKLDTKKPSVKMSARHHHRHLYRLYTTRSRRVFLCIVINARTNRERNWEKLMRKSNESIPHWTTSRNRISLSLFIRAEQLSLSSPRGVKKERKNNKKKPRETRRWKHHSLSLSSYLTSLCFYILTRLQFKDDFMCRRKENFSFSNESEREKSRKH